LVEADHGIGAAFVECDVTEPDALRRAVEMTERFGGIDVMVNNAGFAERAPIEDLSIADAQKMFRINVEGVYHGMKAVIPGMKESGSGSIMNVASGVGKTAVPQLAAYSGSKAAVIRMTEAVAQEAEGAGVTVNAVCPGRTRTAMTDFEGVPPETVADTIYEVATAAYTGEAIDT